MKSAGQDAAEQRSGFGAGTLLPSLADEDRTFVEGIVRDHRLTFQELRFAAQAARDLQMWSEPTLEQWWNREAASLRPGDRAGKKRVLERLRAHIEALQGAEKRYPSNGLSAPPRSAVKLRATEESHTIFGACPARSERTVCCGLHTLDTIAGCPFACSYCTIQTFYGDEARIPTDLPARLRDIQLDPERFYHIGTGQASDSLVWGNRRGVLDALFRFAEEHPNVLLELKSKSSRVAPLLTREVPRNVVCSWSLNSDVIIRNEEHGTATLDERLGAARQLADHKTRVAFHFHPLVHYQGCDNDYRAAVEQLLERFQPQEVAFVSFGTVTMIRPVIQRIRQRGGQTKILQMPLSPDPHGKMTYPDATKIAIYQQLYRAFEPWHEQVFFYLCMEKASIWQAVFGFCYDDNATFERSFAERCR